MKRALEVVALHNAAFDRAKLKKHKVAAQPVAHAFPVDEDDHAETPLLAYEHVAPFLEQLAAKLSKRRDQLVVYDPYYCAGGVKERLASLGAHVAPTGVWCGC